MSRLVVCLLALLACTASAFASSGLEQQTAPFSLPALPYADDALAPAIDAETMRLHHGRHHKAYVDNLNTALEAASRHGGADLGAVLAKVSSYDGAVRNNAGGHYNHSLFWTLMAPAGQGGAPSARLAARIAQDFGSHEAFVSRFEAAARGVFGSGWVWLIARPDGSLAITTTANQDNPLMDVVAERGTPLLALDVWEHGYYLQYRNRRADYIAAWWTVVNWAQVNRRYAAL
ncbi:superoxide dismutase [Luteimonas sp. FCS-9]|uniref:superoxide dismutase n=1 Tax=Luteimonas sp. FCS-9 TaxID=1547516 RepID=UPI00063EB1A9|nr:superoxide dismutase [Luteimonas sp. FCS-9]KLJ00770.1 superoxide dismutase [Luteimonas sp. FCS-9]